MPRTTCALPPLEVTRMAWTLWRCVPTARWSPGVGTRKSSCGRPHLGHHDFLYCTCYHTSAVAFTEQDVRVRSQHQQATGWPLIMTLDGVHAGKLEKALERLEREWSSVVGLVQSLTSSTPSDRPTAEAVLQVLEREAGAL